MTRNDQLRHQAARNKALAEEYVLAGDAESYDFWMRAAGWLLAEVREETNFPQGSGNAAGFHCSGQNSHRGGNCIKALQCFFSQRTARVMNGLKTMLSVTRSAAAMMSSIFIVMRSDDGAVSNLNGGGLCA